MQLSFCSVRWTHSSRLLLNRFLCFYLHQLSDADDVSICGRDRCPFAHISAHFLTIMHSQTQLSRREQTLIIKLGHSCLTHFLKDEDPPICIPCNSLLTVEHLLINCIDQCFLLLTKTKTKTSSTKIN